LLRFEYFKNNWLDVSNLLVDKGHLNVTLTANFFDNLRFDESSLSNYKKNAAINLMNMLGSKPALCFSGGIDSQATWHCFNEAGIDIEVYCLKFKHDLNKQDIEHAILFAEQNNIKLNIIEIDIIQFLSRENADYAKKYKSLSPHFNTHYKLCNILLSKGYTGFVCGGGAPLLSTKHIHYASNYNKNFLNYINYSQISDVLCQGNFLGYDPYLAWAIAILTPVFDNDIYGSTLNKEERDRLEYQRYLEKIKGYKKIGFDIIPQTKKFTGFELVKNELEKIYGDGWAFEKKYRDPLRLICPEYAVNINFDNELIAKIESLYTKNFTTGYRASSGI